MIPTPPTTTPPERSFRLSGLVLTAIILLALLLGLLLGAIVGGAGGFIAGRNNAQAAAGLLPMASSAPAQAQPNAGGSRQTPSNTTPTQPNGGSRQTPGNTTPTQPNGANPQAQPDSANPTTPFGGRGNRQTPGGTTPTQPNGANPQAQPDGANPTTPFGGRGNRQTPGGTTPTQPNGANPQAQPDSANPQAQPTLRVYLGIRYTTLTSDVASQLGVSDVQGAVIGEVVSGSPAEKAGLQPMDVITAVDGKPLSDTYTLIDALSGHKPGDKVQLTVWRLGESETIEVTLGSPAGQG